jgi:hypothetical protein
MMLAAVALALTVSLSDGPRSARLFDEPRPQGAGVLLAQAAAELAPAAADATPKTLAELRAEYDRLDRSRPKLFPPIIMLAGGVVALLPGIILSMIGFGPYLPGVTVNPALGNTVPYLVIGLVLLAAGITFAIIGAVTLGPVLKTRKELGIQMAGLEERIELLEPPDDESLPPNRGRVRLTVRDRKTGAPLAATAVKVGGETLRTNADGIVATGELPPGPVAVEVERAEYVLLSEAVLVIARRTAEISIGLVAERDKEPAIVSGIVRSIDGGKRLKATVAIEQLKLETTAGDDGSFSLTVPEGSYWVTITARGYAPQQRPLDLKPGDRTILNVDLHRAR